MYSIDSAKLVVTDKFYCQECWCVFFQKNVQHMQGLTHGSNIIKHQLKTQNLLDFIQRSRHLDEAARSVTTNIYFTVWNNTYQILKVNKVIYFRHMSQNKEQKYVFFTKVSFSRSEERKVHVKHGLNLIILDTKRVLKPTLVLYPRKLDSFSRILV